jgi:hypothetical protein
MPKRTGTEHVVLQGSDFFCSHCGDRYTMNMPAPISLMVAACDAFAKDHRDCRPDPRVAERERARREAGFANPDAWRDGPDTGISSMTIWSVVTGKGTKYSRFDVPHDPADFGRCYRLLKAFSWRDRLPDVVARFPEWEPMVREWDRMTAIYERDLPTGESAELFALMQKLEKEGRALVGGSR